MHIYDRVFWGALVDEYEPQNGKPPFNTVLHHSAAATDLDEGSSPEMAIPWMQRLEGVGVRRFEVGISYTFVVSPGGHVFEGHPMNKKGAHDYNMNSTTIGICVLGDYRETEPTGKALHAIKELLRHCVAQGWISAPVIWRGHRQLYTTECPGDLLYNKIAYINGKDGDRGGSEGLQVDGYWGKSTTRLLQRVLGTPVDGVVSSQDVAHKAVFPACTTGWEWVANAEGSLLIQKLQEKLGVGVDGIFGPGTANALIARMGFTPDGRLDDPSSTVMEMQRRLKRKTF